MAIHLDVTLRLLASTARDLPEEQRQLLATILDDLRSLVASDRDGQAAEKALRRLSTYIKRQAKPTSSLRSEALALALVRNQLMHGKVRLASLDLQPLRTILWRELERHADVWPVDEIEHLLAYCVGKAPPRAKWSDQTGVVRVYKNLFRTLPEDEKDRAFKELLLRVLSEPAFREQLDRDARDAKARP